MKSGVFLVLSAALMSAGCSQRALKHRSEPMNEKASIQYQFAYDAYVQGDLIPALGFALKTVELAPYNSEAHNLLGLIYFRQQKYGEAEAAFKKGVEIDPKSSEIYNNLGTMYYETKRYREAMAALNKALENPLYLYPERIYNNIGLVESALGHKPNAIDAYERSIQLRPTFYLPYQNLGELFLEMNQSDKAKALLEKATQLCQDCAEPRYRLGSLLLKEKKASEALKFFKQGAKVDPDGYYGQLCKQYIVEPK